MEKVICYVLKERDIERIIEENFNVTNEFDETVNLIKESFITLCDYLYSCIKFFYIHTSKSSYAYSKEISERDLDKVNILRRFLYDEDIFVLDVYDFLYTFTSIYDLPFSIDFYDFIGLELNKRNIEFEAFDNYFHNFFIIFNYFILNMFYNTYFLENEENIVFGLKLIDFNHEKNLLVFIYL